MKIIGITGGIASGKSTVSNIIKDLGYKVIDADVVAREIVNRGEPALKEIVESFGKEVLNEDGTLNRKYLGSIVFSDSDKLYKLNKITHKRIMKRIKGKISFYENNTKERIIFLDAALLIEMGMQHTVDEVWLVSVDRKIQIKRLMERDNISYEEALGRINSQMTLKEKEKHADVLIDNSKDLEHLKKHINRLVSDASGGA